MSTGQTVGGVVGATIGAFVGGPAGAIQGAQIGMMAGGYLDPPKGPTVSGPTLSDLTIQTSTYGAAIPRVYGTIAISGNILWLENDKLKPTVHKKKQGGKGGGSTQTIKTTTYSATFAIGICLGEIAGVRRIWCADKLIYNAGSGDLETIIAGNKNAKGWRLYLGTDDQQPDPRYEASKGVGNIPAFRGIAYIVFDDFQLADYGDTLQAANFKFEVVTKAQFSDMFLAALSAQDDILYPIFSADDGAAAVRTYTGAAGSSSWAIYDHYAGNKVYAGSIDRTGYKGDPARRVVGKTDVFLVATTNNAFFCDDRVFTSTSFGSGWGNFDAVYDASGKILYVLGRDGSGTTKLSRMSEGGFSSEAATTSLCSIAMGDGVLYGISTSAITTFDLDDLTQLSSVPITPTYAIPGATGTYISHRDGLIYLFPYLNDAFASSKALQIFDATTGALVSLVSNMPDAGYTSSRGGPAVIYDGVITQCAVSGTQGVRYVAYDQLDPETIPIGGIISTEMQLSSLLNSGDIDLSLLTDSLTGYRVSGGSIRSAIEPIQGAFPFDAIQSGYKIKAVPRGQSSVADIPWGDLGATDGSQGVMLDQSREMDSQLPYRVAITYLDQAREYAVSEQYAERSFTGAVNRVDRELPIVMSADKASSVAETLLFLPHLERVDLSFKLPPTYADLEPADVVTVSTQDATYSVRLTEINYGSTGLLECKGKPNSATIYVDTAAGAEAPGPDGTIPLVGVSVFIPLDIPVIDETAQNSAGFIGAMFGYSNGWPGAVLVRSADGGQTWVDLQGFTGKATVGLCRGTLPASTCTVIDLRSLQIDAVNGSFYSVTRDQMLGGVNYAAYGVDGRWEIVRFQNAVLQADGSYIISGFIRGERGTEWATGLHQSNDYFILLDDPDLIFMGAAVEVIGTELDYRAVTSGESVDSAADQPFTYRGVNLECLSPIYPAGVRDGSSNFIGSFTRRSRLSSSWWTSGVSAPVGEASESYEIDVMSGATVKRTITVSSPAFGYSAADQTTDFGAAQSSIAFKIYQLSAVVGRGYPLEVTL